MRSRPFLWLLATCLALAVAAGRAVPDDAKPTTKDWSSGDGRFTISLSAAWQMEREPIGESVMAWRASLPEAGGSVELHKGK